MCGLNTVGGVLACPWFVNDWHSLRIMPLETVLIWRDALCKPRTRMSGSAVLIFGSCANPVKTLCKSQARKNGSGNAGRP